MGWRRLLEVASLRRNISFSPETGLRPLSEIRVQINRDRYRVADVAIISKDSAREAILTTPPLIVIEIEAPEDRVSRYRERLEDYRKMGVQSIWVVDPVAQECWNCSSGAWMPAERLEVSGSPVYLDIRELPL